MLIVDSPSAWTTKDTAKTAFLDAATDHVGTNSANAVLYFPRLMEAQSAARQPARDLRAVRGGRRNLGADRHAARRLESAGGSGRFVDRRACLSACP